MVTEGNLKAPSGKCKNHGRGCAGGIWGSLGEPAEGELALTASPGHAWKHPGKHVCTFSTMMCAWRAPRDAMETQNDAGNPLQQALGIKSWSRRLALQTILSARLQCCKQLKPCEGAKGGRPSCFFHRNDGRFVGQSWMKPLPEGLLK